MSALRPAGELLREWRQKRRLSQLELALEAGISTRHLSFLETGRSQASREMILRLAEFLEIPLRERNALLNAAGFAQVYPHRSLQDPALAPALRAVELVLAGHEPYPALAVDRHWTLLAANRAVPLLLEGIEPELLDAPVNVLRLSLQPRGLAPRIVNFASWRAHLLERLRLQHGATGDPVLRALLDELAGYPVPADADERTGDEHGGVAVPLVLRAGDGTTLSLLSTTTVFGTPRDVTLSELALECFFPADAATAAALQRCAPA